MGFPVKPNLKAVWTGAQAAGNIMKESGGGTIINISLKLLTEPRRTMVLCRSEEWCKQSHANLSG